MASMIEKKAMSIQKEIEKYSTQITRRKALLEKKVQKAIKLNANWSDEEAREHYDTCTQDQRAAWFDLSLARDSVKEAEDHLANAESRLRKLIPELEKAATKEEDADTFCEHCRTRRVRKDTYIVRNTETGEFKQVGKSCLKDFTGGLSAEQVAQYISWFDEVIRGQAVEPGFKHYESTEEILQNAVESVRLYGFTKTEAYGNAISTKQVVLEQVHHFGSYRERIELDDFDPDHRGNSDKVKAIMAWVASLPMELGYISNLKTTLAREYCENRDVGIICSAVASYNREMERQERKARERKQASKSQWVGNEGDRIELHNMTIRLLTGWETEFGYTYLYKFVDDQGNIYTWKTGKWLGDGDEVKDTQRISLKGTVKKHSEFNGELQTELTRCKVL